MTAAPGTVPDFAPSARAVLSRAGGENFPVASRLLPARTREHLLAIYGFARLVDEVGDEVPADRLAVLDWMDGEVDAVYAGTPAHPLMRRLARTVRRFDIPPEPFRALIRANRQDQTVDRYPIYADLQAYCRLSANPVGRMVLYVFEAATPERFAWSDSICTGLQLAEHWQDVAEDLARGRIYLPQEDLAAFGCAEEDLRRTDPTRAFRSLMRFEVGRARGLLLRGLPLVRSLRGRSAAAVAAFAGGGLSALDAIERAGYDVLGATPRPTRRERAWTIVGTLARAVIGAGP